MFLIKIHLTVVQQCLILVSVYCSSSNRSPDPAEFVGNTVFLVENSPMQHTAWTSLRANSCAPLSFLYN